MRLCVTATLSGVVCWQRGQNLDPFLKSFLISTETTQSKPGYVVHTVRTYRSQLLLYLITFGLLIFDKILSTLQGSNCSRVTS